MDIREAFTFATYPYFIIGAMLAFSVCAVSAWRLRKRKIDLWWLLVGISLAILSAFFETLWSMLFKLQRYDIIYLGPFIDRSRPESFILQVPIRTLGAFGVWILATTVLIVNWGKVPASSWIKRTLLWGTAFWIVTYPMVVLLGIFLIKEAL